MVGGSFHLTTLVLTNLIAYMFYLVVHYILAHLQQPRKRCSLFISNSWQSINLRKCSDIMFCIIILSVASPPVDVVWDNLRCVGSILNSGQFEVVQNKRTVTKRYKRKE